MLQSQSKNQLLSNYDQPLGRIDKETTRYLHLTKKYSQRHFLCDSCGQEYQSAAFYSLAYYESEIPYKRVYCENCLSQIPAGQQRLRKELMKNKTTKLKKTKKVTNTNQTKLALTLPSALPVKSKNKTPSTKSKGYYQCMSACCRGKNITKVAQECKTNAPALLASKSKERTQEITKIKNSWKQIAVSLSKLITN